ncbi:hypothetical protein, conserved [Eimeria tenella]|uniref:Uncharacterized protein n=1 Tax=Eimeria tenella TaxID=5802 RepID=U6LB74_EIMTE|nr:hypothetical protein, conserved [Eimeria tenella]CDJ45000.1 hypothetical protein, conserved [Eimeria tenella]|eukprot:XP_013235747.1 hypothetical protein, conserved [Eimeria tenella]
MRPAVVKSVVLLNSHLSAEALWASRASLRSLLFPFLSLLPHAALRKIIISHFLRPLKPVAVPATAAAAADPSSSSSSSRSSSREDGEGEDLFGAFCSSSQLPQDSRAAAAAADAAAAAAAAAAPAAVLLQPQETLEVKNSKEFLIAQLETLTAAELAARLALHLSLAPPPFVPHLAKRDCLLLLQTLDCNFAAAAAAAATALLQQYPEAKIAEMRSGGPFPFLAAADEVSMHLELHLRRCGAAPWLHAHACKSSSSSSSSSSSGSGGGGGGGDGSSSSQGCCGSSDGGAAWGSGGGTQQQQQQMQQQQQQQQQVLSSSSSVQGHATGVRRVLGDPLSAAAAVAAADSSSCCLLQPQSLRQLHAHAHDPLLQQQLQEDLESAAAATVQTAASSSSSSNSSSSECCDGSSSSNISSSNSRYSSTSSLQPS